MRPDEICASDASDERRIRMGRRDSPVFYTVEDSHDELGLGIFASSRLHDPPTARYSPWRMTVSCDISHKKQDQAEGVNALGM
jgi:hypothetical protein